MFRFKRAAQEPLFSQLYVQRRSLPFFDFR